MKQEFNRAMDQVTLPPEAEARIISVLEGKTAGSPPAAQDGGGKPPPGPQPPRS